MLFDSSPRTLHEGIWEIERVEPLNESSVLVSFKTAFFKTEEGAADPSVRRPEERGPSGNSIQTVALPIEDVPTVDDFNSGNRNKLYTALTEKLELKTETRD